MARNKLALAAMLAIFVHVALMITEMCSCCHLWRKCALIAWKRAPRPSQHLPPRSRLFPRRAKKVPTLPDLQATSATAVSWTRQNGEQKTKFCAPVFCCHKQTWSSCVWWVWFQCFVPFAILFLKPQTLSKGNMRLMHGRRNGHVFEQTYDVSVGGSGQMTGIFFAGWGWGILFGARVSSATFWVVRFGEIKEFVERSKWTQIKRKKKLLFSKSLPLCLKKRKRQVKRSKGQEVWNEICSATTIFKTTRFFFDQPFPKREVVEPWAFCTPEHSKIVPQEKTIRIFLFNCRKIWEPQLLLSCTK